MSKFLELNPQVFIDAYEKVGIKPIFGSFYDKRIDKNAEEFICGCPLTVLNYANDDSLDIEIEINEDKILKDTAEKYGIEVENIINFYEGFDSGFYIGDNEYFDLGVSVRQKMMELGIKIY